METRDGIGRVIDILTLYCAVLRYKRPPTNFLSSPRSPVLQPTAMSFKTLSALVLALGAAVQFASGGLRL